MHLARPIGVLALLCSLSACADGLPFLGGQAGEDSDVTRRVSNFEQPEGEEASAVISTLLERRSLLDRESIYGTVAEAAVAASARASEAELVSAKLRAEAEAKNWLPTIGPSVSLTDLGDLVASMLIEQVLFDNGRRKAERDFAAADVEVAAVNLSIDMNERVENAVGLYVGGLRGDEKAAFNGRALKQMQEFRRIVSGRVEGGLSDRSDLNVVDSKINGMRNARTTAQDAAATARAELTAMTGQSFDEKPSTLDLGTPPSGSQYLSVLKSQSVANRSVAEAKVGRAGLLPQIAAAGNITSDGSGAGLTLDLAEPLGLGTPAALKAIKASEEAARRQIGEAEEDARRTYSRQIQRLASYKRQTTETASLARTSRETYRLFKAQFEAGQRPVMDVVSIYEELVQREQDYIDAKYQVVLIQLELARDMGLLADGDTI
ncbi:type I secretion outer membrane protein, TolC family [Phaeobacter sp. CECT 5382]|uniref:TolC family protein n=1 Tax=Rhodobacterales TaxID=204455 RepID=UPI0006DB2270|nr:TolC family protein [Phaeobacter sp. CECT 5382]CUH89098.1 type I secretion outer membrane protein, TolC family [Phaeobacter sp. CECT 5382]